MFAQQGQPAVTNLQRGMHHSVNPSPTHRTQLEIRGATSELQIGPLHFYLRPVGIMTFRQPTSKRLCSFRSTLAGAECRHVRLLTSSKWRLTSGLPSHTRVCSTYIKTLTRHPTGAPLEYLMCISKLKFLDLKCISSLRWGRRWVVTHCCVLFPSFLCLAIKLFQGKDTVGVSDHCFHCCPIS